MSPTVFRDGPYRFYFFSREEPRMHVHVSCSDGEAKFWLEPVVALAQNYGLSEKQVKDAQVLVEAHADECRKSWKLTSGVEVSNVSPHGFWLLIGSEELFVSFSSFPWFRNATIAQITNLEMPSVRHLYWPDLDIDLAVESLRNPESFPLVSRAGA